MPNDGKIDIQEAQTITFINYLNNKPKEVKPVTIAINPRYPTPTYEIKLPSDFDNPVDNTTKIDWDNAEVIEGKTVTPVDLYGGTLPDGTQHVANFAITGHDGNSDGWSYAWKLGEEIKSNSKTWAYDASSDNPTEGSYKDIEISYNVVNEIPGDNNHQIGNNIGRNETKSYFVRVWREADLPKKESFIFTDNDNKESDFLSLKDYKNDIMKSHAIREGNTLNAKIGSIQFGFNPNGENKYYHYTWEAEAPGIEVPNDNKTIEWSTKLPQDDSQNKPGSKSITYKLTVSNIGPRGNVWAEDNTYEFNVNVYNRPKTPKSLVIKGNGEPQGTSGTMIISYDAITNDGMSNSILQRDSDYVIAFCYTDENGKLVTKYKPQDGDDETYKDYKRWAIGNPSLQKRDAYALALWYYKDKTTGQNVLITSGKRSLDDTTEKWDESRYGFPNDMIKSIRAITRSGSEDFGEIQTMSPDDLTDGEVRVYNLNGMMVGTSTDNLPSGIYVVHYIQNGAKKTKKLSVK